MACIIKKIKKGRPYYYAVESARVNGKPRIVWQKYLGTLDDIVKRSDADSGTNIKEVDIFEAGGIAAMLKIIERTNLVNIINEMVPKIGQGPSVGHYIALAIMNRILCPCSKLQMPDWYKSTILARLWGFNPNSFSSQNFWNNMDLLTEDLLEKIQRKVAITVKDAFGINPQLLLYDTTNFFTYIATHNNRNSIAKRGRSKAKRHDLRQVGLAMLVTKDFHIPIFHRVYEGNRPDGGLFPEMASEIIKDSRSILEKTSETTMVFDKGNISEDAMERLIVSQQHFVCAISKVSVPKLFSTDLEKLSSVSGLIGTKAYSENIIIWNKTLKATVTYSESYFTSQIADVTECLQKCVKKLNDLDIDLSKSIKIQSRRSMSSVKKSVTNILTGPYLKDIIKVTFLEEKGYPRIAFSIDTNHLDYISKHEFGRTLLITSRMDWKEENIISSYRGQNSIESAFRKMKNQDYLHWQPAFHWTDQKIKVHGLYCVLALLVASLAHKIVSEGQIDISFLEMIEELNKIREVALISVNNQNGKESNQLTLSRMSSKQKALADILEIATVVKG